METSKGRQVAAMSMLLMSVLGTVYAWSFFQPLVAEQFGWSQSEVAWAFSTAIGTLGLSAAWGGTQLARYGVRVFAVAGALLYGAGYMLSAWGLKSNSLLLFILGFGLIGGIGLGLGYVTPVVAATRWFPKKKGLISGMVIMGFGLGALMMSKVIAPMVLSLNDQNLVSSFFYIGLVLMALGTTSAMFVKLPGKEEKPRKDPPLQPEIKTSPSVELSAGGALLTSRFLLIWMVFFINITAGIMFISFQSPMLQDLFRRFNRSLTPVELSAAGATLIAVSSLFNGMGRFLWGGISDKIGRTSAFRIILGSQVLVFVALLFIENPYWFAVLVCYVLLCYGGGFGVIPSYVHDVFGVRLMPVLYGAMLTAWSAGGIAGAQIVALLRDGFPLEPATAAFYAFLIGSVLLAVGFISLFFLNDNPVAGERQ